ncbi:MAG: glycosyl hydrolase family protein [Lachnospiraceae bacterium]|nr:glycosyl hydrolase family protein [Lachnospiraceae bacterium]
MKMNKIFKRIICCFVISLLFGNSFRIDASASTPLYTDSVFEDQFNAHNSSTMEIADGWSNGGMFNCTWRRDNVSFQSGKMVLKIDRDKAGSATPYSGGEYRTKSFFHYGKYEVRMKPIKNDGVVSSFFTYTGPVDGNPWDEIDIEFLGKDTTKVQFNYFINGVGGHEYIYNLGFVASQDFHTYGFEWLPGSITWFVDGRAVYTATQQIPSTPGKIMMNVWPGTGVDNWLKPYNGRTPLQAEYDWIKYTQYNNTGSTNHSGTINWSTDEGWAQYTLEKVGTTTIVYRYGNQNAAWANLIGNMQNSVNGANRLKLRLNFIDGNILALTLKVKDTNGNEAEIGQVSYSTWQKGIKELEIPFSTQLGPIKQVILFINSNPYQLDLQTDAHCKVELLNAEVYKY